MRSLIEALPDLYGRSAWGAIIGIGTHVLISFGEGALSPRTGKARASFEIWIPGSPWRLESPDTILIGSGQESIPSGAIGILNGDRIVKIDLCFSYFDILIVWESGIRLHVLNELQEGDLMVFFFPDVVYSIDAKGVVSSEGRSPLDHPTAMIDNLDPTRSEV